MSSVQPSDASEPDPLLERQAQQIQELQTQLSLLRRTHECLCRDNADLKRGRDALLARVKLLEETLSSYLGTATDPPQSTPEQDLFPVSDRWLLKTSRADYTQLKQLLAQQAWEEADCETQRLMLQVAGAEAEALGFLTTDHLLDFPCLDLKIINKLWTIYSNGHYGFTIQREIWAKSRSTRNLWVSPEFPGYYPKREGLGHSLAQRLLRCALDDF